MNTLNLVRTKYYGFCACTCTPIRFRYPDFILCRVRREGKPTIVCAVKISDIDGGLDAIREALPEGLREEMPLTLSSIPRAASRGYREPSTHQRRRRPPRHSRPDEEQTTLRVTNDFGDI